MFLIASLLCLTLPKAQAAGSILDVHLAGRAVTETRRGIADAFHYLRATPIVTWAMIYIALTNTLVAIAGALAPASCGRSCALGERNVVVLVGPAGVGVVAGLGLLNFVSRRIGRPHAIGSGLIVTAVALVSPPRPGRSRTCSPTRVWAGAERPRGRAALLHRHRERDCVRVRVAYSFINVPAMTLLQEELPDESVGACSACSTRWSRSSASCRSSWSVPPRTSGASRPCSSRPRSVVFRACGSRDARRVCRPEKRHRGVTQNPEPLA